MSIQNGNEKVVALTTYEQRLKAIRTAVELYRDIEFAAALGVSKPTVYRLTAKGMPTIRIGRVRWINPQEAMAWLKANAQPGPGRPSGRKGIPRRKKAVAAPEQNAPARSAQPQTAARGHGSSASAPQRGLATAA